jgi:hypothetical protein
MQYPLNRICRKKVMDRCVSCVRKKKKIRLEAEAISWVNKKQDILNINDKFYEK